MANTSFSTITLLSFSQWLDNWLLANGQAYTNTVSRFYHQADTSLPASTVAYASPFKSFVWDSGVSGANILESISGSNGVISRGQSGMMVDFVNGRVLLDSAVGTAATISGSYAFKDFNLYFANQSQERMVFSNKYYLNSRFARPVTGIPPAYDMVTPCIFISNVAEENEPMGFGGLYNTKTHITLNIMAETIPQLQGAMSLITTAEQVNFPQLNTNVWPLNSYGDYKSGYNYQTILGQYGQGNNLYTITDISASTFGDGVKIDESVFCGIVEMVVERQRTIH